MDAAAAVVCCTCDVIISLILLSKNTLSSTTASACDLRVVRMHCGQVSLFYVTCYAGLHNLLLHTHSDLAILHMTLIDILSRYWGVHTICIFLENS